MKEKQFTVVLESDFETLLKVNVIGVEKIINFINSIHGKFFNSEVNRVFNDQRARDMFDIKIYSSDDVGFKKFEWPILQAKFTNNNLPLISSELNKVKK